MPRIAPSPRPSSAAGRFLVQAKRKRKPAGAETDSTLSMMAIRTRRNRVCGVPTVPQTFRVGFLVGQIEKPFVYKGFSHDLHLQQQHAASRPRDHVVIPQRENGARRRIIPDRRPPAPAGERAAVDGRLARALGEGDTRVVETTNLSEFTRLPGRSVGPDARDGAWLQAGFLEAPARSPRPARRLPGTWYIRSAMAACGNSADDFGGPVPQENLPRSVTAPRRLDEAMDADAEGRRDS